MRFTTITFFVSLLAMASASALPEQGSTLAESNPFLDGARGGT